MDSRRPRRTGLEFAQAIGVLSRQRIALEKIAQRLTAAGFPDAARSVSEIGDRLTELAAAVKVEGDAVHQARTAEMRRTRAYRAPASADDDFFSRAYSVGPCPDCKARAGLPCGVFRPARGPKSDHSNLGKVTGWPHHGRIAMARASGAFEGFRPTT